MKRLAHWFGLVMWLMAVTAGSAQVAPREQPSPAALQILFSPKGGCTDAIVAALDVAKASILVQAYSFTSAPIAQAVVRAHQRGVKVQVLLDKSQETEKYSSATFLANHGVPVFIDAAHKIAHNKVMVIDGALVITGSFNFSKAAENDNAENLVLIRDAGKALLYEKNWRDHSAHCKPYRRKVPLEATSTAVDDAEEPPLLLADASPATGTPLQVIASAAPKTDGMVTAYYFGPKGGGTAAIVAAIDAAKKRVWVFAHAFTSRPIGAALARAFARQVDVKMIFDPGQKVECRAATIFARLGDVAWIDSEHAQLLNNTMVIDDDRVVVSTAPFTKVGDVAGAGTTMFIAGQRAAADFAKNWETHKNHSVRQRSDGRGPAPEDGPADKFWLVQAGTELFIVEVSELCDGDEPMDIIRPYLDRHVGMALHGIADTLEGIKGQADSLLGRSSNLRLRPGVF